MSKVLWPWSDGVPLRHRPWLLVRFLRTKIRWELSAKGRAARRMRGGGFWVKR